MEKVKAKKHLGQHFLNDESIAAAIAGTLNFEGYEEVLEIGPGMGVLTKYLLDKPITTYVIEIDTESVTYLENNFSLLGVKGTEKIADGYDVVYQMEFQVENTSGSGDVFKARNTFLGLKNNAGTVLVGRNDTVFKQAEGNVDVFGNTNADIDRLVSAQTRSADGVWYYSPKIANLVTSYNFSKVFLIGKAFSATGAKNAFVSESFESFKNSINYSNINNATILIKGSRGMALERLLDLF